MPIQAPQWTEFLSCPICCHEFDGEQRSPISLGCGHTVCRACLGKLQRNQCPYDQNVMKLDLDQLPVNSALLSLVSSNGRSNDPNNYGTDVDEDFTSSKHLPSAVPSQHAHQYSSSVKNIVDLALLLKPFANAGSGLNGNITSALSRPMQRKLVTLINCQLVDEEGRARAVRAARFLGERSVTELILHHQNHHQLSANLWAAVRSRGCQFLGPAMQEEVLKLVLLALEDGSALSRKVLVMFVVQRLEPHFPQASKTSIGHVVQLLYRASCFKVSKRECDSSLMKLKEEFRTYDSLRREHDAQIVQIATEAGLRIAPDMWSSLLYGDMVHKSHMQSIMDKLQTPQSFGQSVQELIIALQRTGDPGHLSSLRQPLELLAEVDPSPEIDYPDWDFTASALDSVKTVVLGLVNFIQLHGNRKLTESYFPYGAKFKTSLCRDLAQRGGCPRGNDCTFAHTEDELMKFRNRSRKQNKIMMGPNPPPINNQHDSGMSQHSSSSSHDPKSIQPNNHQVQSKGTQPIYRASGNAHHQNKTVQPCHQQIQTKTYQPPTPQPSPHPPLPEYQDYSSAHTASIGKHLPQNQLEMARPILKNGEPSSLLPLISNPSVVEGGEVPPTPPTPALNPYEVRSYVPVCLHSNLPVIAPTPVATPSPGIIRPAFATPPPPRPTPIYATPLPEYTYQTFHPQGPIFAQSTGPGPPNMIRTPGGQHPTALFSSQHIPPMIPEIYSPNPQTLLLNQGQVYNILAPSPDFHHMPPGHQAPPISFGDDGQNFFDKPEWLNSVTEESIPKDRFLITQTSKTTSTLTVVNSDTHTSNSSVLASKSLTELKEWKEDLICQLQNIVGEDAVNEMSSQIANNELVITSTPNEYSSTYSIWTSGADFSEITRRKNQVPKEWQVLPRYGKSPVRNGDITSNKEIFIPFDPPIYSKFGPISRNPKSGPQRPLNTIQVSACNTNDPVTTPTVYRPVPAISPMPQMLYQQPPAFATFVSYPPPHLDYMNTIGHGIIDPPHLHMSQLEPSGSRPSDPLVVDDSMQMDDEEQQRRQFIAAKQGGLEAQTLNQKFQELRLKEELNRVMQGIQEKKKEIKESSIRRGQNHSKGPDGESPQEDFDFEKNWKFDFDEGEKDTM